MVVEIRNRATGNLIEDYDRDIEDVEQVTVYGYDGDDWIHNLTANRSRFGDE